MLHPISVDSAISKLRMLEFFQNEAFRQAQIIDSLNANLEDQRAACELWRNDAAVNAALAKKYADLSENRAESRDSYKKLYRNQRRKKGFWKSLSIGLALFIGGKELNLIK